MPHPSFRSVIVCVTFYDSSINALDNLWQKHLKESNHGKTTIFSIKSIQAIV